MVSHLLVSISTNISSSSYQNNKLHQQCLILRSNNFGNRVSFKKILYSLEPIMKLQILIEEIIRINFKKENNIVKYLSCISTSILPW